MDSLEQDLREAFARQAASLPPRPALAAEAVRRGKRARRRRTGGGAVGGIVVAGLALGLLVPSWSPAPDGDRSRDDRSQLAAQIEGPPRVPLVVPAAGGGGNELLEWTGGQLRSRSLGSAEQVAQVPGGLIVVDADPLSLGLLGPDDAVPRVLVRGLASRSVAVSDDGRRATVLTSQRGFPELNEVELPTGRSLRSVALAPPLVGAGEPVLPVAYSGRAVLLSLGQGGRQRSALWEQGSDEVVAELDGVGGALGGADAPFSDDRDALGGRGAFALRGDRCSAEVSELRNGDGAPWRLCAGVFQGFSPDGRQVLAVVADAGDGALVVHDAGTGEVGRTFTADGVLRGAGWETDDSVLSLTEAEGGTLVMRCQPSAGTCVTVAELPYEGLAIRPVRVTG